MTANYEYYRIFYYVGKSRSISRAAKLLENSQPNVTRAMHNLEAQLGCKLLIRSTKGIELTPEGQRLFDHVAVAVRHISDAERELAAAQALETGELFIAATEVALHRVLLSALQRFRKCYPGVRVRVSNYSTPEAVEAIRNEQAELAVVSLAEPHLPGLCCVPLSSYSEIVVAGNEYQALAAAPHTLQELTGYPWISLSQKTQTFRFYDTFFMHRGLSFEPELQAATMDQILPMVKRDLGLAFLPEFMARPAIRAGEIQELPLCDSIPSRTICALYQKNTCSRAAQKLLENLCCETDENKPCG